MSSLASMRVTYGRSSWRCMALKCPSSRAPLGSCVTGSAAGQVMAAELALEPLACHHGSDWESPNTDGGKGESWPVGLGTFQGKGGRLRERSSAKRFSLSS